MSLSCTLQGHSRVQGAKGSGSCQPRTGAAAGGDCALVFKENGICTNPWPSLTEPTLSNENANHPSQTWLLQMCERDFAVKLVSDRRIHLQFFPEVFLVDLTGTAFPMPVIRAAEAGREHQRDWSIRFPWHLVVLHQLVLFEHILNYPQCFMIIIFRGHFSYLSHSLQLVFPLLNLLKRWDSPSEIRITAIWLFLLIVTTKLWHLGCCNMENLMQVEKKESNQTWRRQAWSYVSAVLPTWTSN